LRQALRPHLRWHGARLTFLAEFLIAVFRVKTVNLAELATGFSGRAKVESPYKRLRRFFRDYELEYGAWTRLIAAWMSREAAWRLSLDRTQWHFGSGVVNILVLALVHQGVAIPLVWLFLPNRSNAYTYQRLVLMQRFRLFFPAQAVAFVSADREFIGREWVHDRYRERSSFRIRIRDKAWLDDGHRKLKCLKTRGFCLAATHLSNPTALSKLLALLTLALGWAIRTGTGQIQQHPLPLKKHGRRAKSIFRVGLDHLRNILLNLEHRLADFQVALLVLSST
jgi:hypothetical protein